MGIVDQLDYLWIKFSHAMVVPVVYIAWLYCICLNFQFQLSKMIVNCIHVCHKHYSSQIYPG